MRTTESIFRAALVADRDWRVATDRLVAQLGRRRADTIGFLYATDYHAAALPAIFDRLSAATGITNWVGTIGLGVIANRNVAFDCPAIAAMLGHWPADQISLFDSVASDDWADTTNGMATAIIHLDPRNRRAEALLGTITDQSGAYLVGGITACRSPFYPQVAGLVTDGGASGVLVSPKTPIAIGVAQGCRPIGPARTVTAADDGMILELDGGSPLEALLIDLSAAGVSDLKSLSQSLHAGLVVPNSDRGDYLVRSLTGLDAERGWLSIGEAVSPGGRILFCRRDRHAAEEDLVATASGLRRRLPEVSGALYISCVARGGELFRSAEEEVALLQDALGDLPLIGFYGNGEIAGERIYGHTGIIALF